MRTRRGPLSLLAPALVSLAAAGCGRTATVGTGRALQIALSEYRVIPQDVRARLLEVRVRVAEIRALLRASGRVVAGVEVEDQLAAALA